MHSEDRSAVKKHKLQSSRTQLTYSMKAGPSPGVHFARGVVPRVNVQPPEERQHRLLVGVPLGRERQLAQFPDVDVRRDDDTPARAVAHVVVHAKRLEDGQVAEDHAELGLDRKLIL